MKKSREPPYLQLLRRSWEHITDFNCFPYLEKHILGESDTEFENL